MLVSPVSGLGALAVAMAVAFAVGVAWAERHARGRWLAVGLGVAAVYLGVSAALVASGALAEVDARPPPAGLMLGAMSVGMVALAFSRLGDRLLGLGLAVLVGAQSFRVLVEVLLAAAADAGAVPPEMTWHGFNLDVVTGLTAAALGLWRGSPPRAVVWAWNVLGLGLLAVVVAVAALSAFGVLETSPRLTLPVTWPGVWLPAWLVQLALLGHVLTFRALRQPDGG